MKCKNCGAMLTMTQKFCSNCGAPNEQTSQHIADMENYDKKFTQTRTEVVKNSKWFLKYIAPITTFVIALTAAAFSWISNESMWEYDLVDRVNEKYNTSHREEINNQLQEMLKNRKYYSVYLMDYKLERSLAAKDDKRSWNYFYELAADYHKLRNSIVLYFDPEFESNYSRQRAISTAADAICSAKEVLQVKSAGTKVSSETLPYIEDMREDMYTFLKAYCKFTDEDIKSLPDKDQTEVISLLTRRMFDETDK